MKKLLLTVSILAILGLPKLVAQVINPNFETWSANLFVPAANDPNSGFGSTGWWDLNVLNYSALGSSPITVFKDTYEPFQGMYCAKIVSGTMSTEGYDTIKYYDPSFQYPQTNGLIFAGTVGISSGIKVTTGIPVTSKWQSFSFYYKYYPNGSDTGSCTVAMYHWNSVTNQRDLIGGGVWKTGAMQSAWTPATVGLRYDSTTVTPDTAFILFSAASLYSNPQVNDSMMVDSSSYEAVTGIQNITGNRDNVNLYPNPANNQINLTVTGEFKANKIEVYDITGKIVGVYSINNNSLSINTQTYTNGMYLYKLLDNTGIQLNVGKFSIVR
jgi:hypothetical protein